MQKLISECVAKRAVQDLSLLFCGGWAAECDASCVPLDLVVESDDKNRDELVRLLLQHGADASNLVERDGESILHASLRIGLKKGKSLNSYCQTKFDLFSGHLLTTSCSKKYITQTDPI